MEKPTIPTAVEVAAALDGVRGHLYASLEHGTAVAIAHFGSHFGDGARVDGSLGAHMTRLHAKRYLVERGIPCDSIPLSGIAFRMGGYSIRVLKADGDGELPAPGKSLRKQVFYNQVQLALGLDLSESEIGPEVNVVVLWEVDWTTSGKVTLSLACPKSGNSTKSSVEAHWYEPFLHPATQLPGVGAVAGVAAGDTAEDLPIGQLGSESSGEDE